MKDLSIEELLEAIKGLVSQLKSKSYNIQECEIALDGFLFALFSISKICDFGILKHDVFNDKDRISFAVKLKAEDRFHQLEMDLKSWI